MGREGEGMERDGKGGKEGMERDRNGGGGGKRGEMPSVISAYPTENPSLARETSQQTRTLPFTSTL